MSNYTKFAVRSASYILVISLCTAFLAYLVRIIFARNLSVEDFGLFYAVIAFFGLIGFFKNLGLDKALAKSLPEFKAKKQRNLMKGAILFSLGVQIVTNMLVVGMIVLLSSFLAEHYFQTEKAISILYWMVFALFIDSFIVILRFSFFGLKRLLLFEGVDFVRMVLIVIISLIGFQFDQGIFSPVYAYFITPIILFFVFSTVFVRKVFPGFFEQKSVFEVKKLKKMVHFGLFVVTTGVGGMIIGYTDTIMLTYFAGLHAVALYNVAFPTARLLRFFIRPVGLVMLPLTSELWAKGRKELLIDGFKLIYKYSFIILIPLVFTMFSFTDIIINLLYGHDYLAAEIALKILLIGMIFAALHNTHGNFFAGIGKPQITTKIVGIVALINIILNFILIPLFGIVGAALTTTLSFIVMLLLEFKELRKRLNVPFPIQIWGRTFFSGLAFLGSVWVLKKHLAINVWLEAVIVVGISSMVYLSLLFMLQVVNKKELQMLFKRVI